MHLHHTVTDAERLSGALHLASSIALGMDPRAALAVIDPWARPILRELTAEANDAVARARRTAGE